MDSERDEGGTDGDALGGCRTVLYAVRASAAASQDGLTKDRSSWGLPSDVAELVSLTTHSLLTVGVFVVGVMVYSSLRSANCSRVDSGTSASGGIYREIHCGSSVSISDKGMGSEDIGGAFGFLVVLFLGRLALLDEVLFPNRPLFGPALGSTPSMTPVVLYDTHMRPQRLVYLRERQMHMFAFSFWVTTLWGFAFLPFQSLQKVDSTTSSVEAVDIGFNVFFILLVGFLLPSLFLVRTCCRSCASCGQKAVIYTYSLLLLTVYGIMLYFVVAANPLNIGVFLVGFSFSVPAINPVAGVQALVLWILLLLHVAAGLSTSLFLLQTYLSALQRTIASLCGCTPKDASKYTSLASRLRKRLNVSAEDVVEEEEEEEEEEGEEEEEEGGGGGGGHGPTNYLSRFLPWSPELFEVRKGASHPELQKGWIAFQPSSRLVWLVLSSDTLTHSSSVLHHLSLSRSANKLNTLALQRLAGVELRGREDYSQQWQFPPQYTCAQATIDLLLGSTTPGKNIAPLDEGETIPQDALGDQLPKDEAAQAISSAPTSPPPTNAPSTDAKAKDGPDEASEREGKVV